MLAGQGVPDGELTGATKLLVICTAFISIAIFAIPAAMLAWGFESEAERLRERFVYTTIRFGVHVYM
jgi:hypothetical protein